MTALNLLSDNSKISDIPALESIDYFVSFSLRSSLILL